MTIDSARLGGLPSHVSVLLAARNNQGISVGERQKQFIV